MKAQLGFFLLTRLVSMKDLRAEELKTLPATPAATAVETKEDCDGKPKVAAALDQAKQESKAAEEKALQNLGLIKATTAVAPPVVPPPPKMETCK